MGHRVIAVVLAVGLLSVSFMPLASAADGSLVIAALRTLEREYIDPVKPILLLNGAIAALRKASDLGEDILPDIPSDLSEAAAIDKFNHEFKMAAQVGKPPEN